MKYDTSGITERPLNDIRERIARAEAYLPSADARDGATTVARRARSAIRRVPAPAFWTAIASGLLIGLLLTRRQPRTFEDKYLREPLDRARQALTDAVSALAEATRDREAAVLAAARRVDLSPLRQQLHALRRRLPF
ncbi:MAG: hypothetical protein WDN28_27895 [Chthoniobacter sp.]